MRVLLTEDERSLSRAVIAILRHNGYEADAAYDGVQALEMLADGSYDALVLDIMMPKMDGIEVLRRLRADGNRIPVIMLSAKSDVETKVDGLDSGANDYLTKPFETQELLARIRAKMDDGELAAAGWTRHLRKRAGTIFLVSNSRALDWDATVDRVRKIQNLVRPPYAWNKPAMFEARIVVRIPRRFAEIV